MFLNLLGLTWEQRAPLLLRYNGDPKLGPERLAHLTADEYVRCGHMTEDEFFSWFKFSFVRNPWARLVSEFRYQNYQRYFDFKTFIMRGLPKPGNSDAYRHIIPQHMFLYDQDDRLLVDFVGRFERLQADFDSVCDRLNIPPITLPHVNAAPVHSGQGRSYVCYYDDETRDAVAGIYQRDIELFGYSFGE